MYSVARLTDADPQRSAPHGLEHLDMHATRDEGRYTISPDRREAKTKIVVGAAVGCLVRAREVQHDHCLRCG